MQILPYNKKQKNNTKFINSECSNNSDLHRLVLNLGSKTYLKKGDKYIAFSNNSVQCTWENIKYKNNKVKNSTQTWNDRLELPDGSYFM